ncbi:Glycosyl transferase, group 1 domain protein [Rhodopirellula maiorica SM1]|uniref:Glycosyl transferase, group 1 domain protein n=2 Tax=Novipirellula TaxID=2795426 RepID=M5R944_9BACT|nr:Glycosyl transferase, group 1 domain protein [Rhodopirellula maiorica SM1]
MRLVFLTDGPLVNMARGREIPCDLIERGRFSNPVDTFRVVRALRRVIREHDAAVAFSWTDMAQLYAAPASWGQCKSLWWQRANVDEGMIARLCKWFPSSGAIANSKFTRDQLRDLGFQVAEQPLYPPFDATKFKDVGDRDTLRRRLGVPENRYIVGSVGRMQAWKGFDTIVDGIAKVRESRPDVFGLIVGGRHDLEPEYESQLRERIATLGLTEHIMLTGSQRNVAEWMKAMDVFVHAAEREPFGIVVPEAMALGLPVIASIPGGPSEAIEPEVSGLLVHSSEVAELTKAIFALQTNPSVADQLGCRAKQRSLKFSSNGFFDRLKDAVSSCV